MTTPPPHPLRHLALHGPAIRPWVDALAALRLQVFREWPYCYDGSLAYERDYLRCYVESPRAVVALVLDQETPVAATTGLPLAEAHSEMQTPFLSAGLDPADWFYCGESVVLPALRGLGLGGQFFDLREQQARSLGLRRITFCAVERAPDDPRRPSRYRGNLGLWTRRGYQRQPQLQCQYAWRDLGASEDSEKTLTFWTRELGP